MGKEVEKEVEKTISGPDGPDGEAICAVEGPTEVHEPSAFTKGLEQALKNDKLKKIHDTITMIQRNPFGWNEEMQKKTLAKYANAYKVTLPSNNGLLENERRRLSPGESVLHRIRQNSPYRDSPVLLRLLEETRRAQD